jgi:transaldolase
MVAAGVRGVTANPTVLARALEVSAEYDEQLSWLLSTGCTVEETYRELAATDVLAACTVLETLYQTSQAMDGFVSIEVAPDLARRTRGAMAAARRLHQRIDRPNLLVAVPATPRGIPALQAMISSGRNINATSIFSLDRHSAVIDAYLAGLETFIAQGGDPATVHGVASFSLSPVDAEVDRRLEQLGGRRASELRGLAAVAQATLAYRLFEERFSTERWTRLAPRGGTPLRLLWTSAHTSPTTDAPTTAETDTEVGHGSERISRYVEALTMPNTAHALSESTVMALMANGAQTDTISVDPREAAGVMSELGALGIDLDKVAVSLEAQYAEKAQHCLDTVLSRLQAKQGTR